VTIQAHNQLASVAILPARPLILTGRICQYQMYYDYRKRDKKIPKDQKDFIGIASSCKM